MYIIQFIMASSSFICHKLIDDIVQRGGQQVSDKYIVKKCLNKRVLSNKKIISNQLIKQTGIKSEYCTINKDMVSQPQPQGIKKDQYMYKSLVKFNRKVVRHKPKLVVENRKYFSSSKIKRKAQLHQSDRSFKKLTMTSKTFANSDKETNKNQLIALDIQNIQELKIDLEQEKSIDKIRMNIAKNKQQELSEKKQKQLKDKQRLIIEERERRKFQKQTFSGNKNHTYDTNGKYMVYPNNLQQRALGKAFPVSLAIAIQTSQKEKHCKKRKFNNKQPPTCALGLISNIDFHKTLDDHQRRQIHDKSEERNQNRQTVFSNNNKRQISSLQIVNVKPGICFTEPAQGNSVRGETDEQALTTFSKQKAQSTFVKFFSSKIKTEEIDNINVRIPYTKSSTVSKVDFYKDQQDNKSYKLFPKTRPKTSQSNGTIKEINQTLLKKWIRTAK